MTTYLSHPAMETLRDLQTRLYREIGIQAVAVALDLDLDFEMHDAILKSAQSLRADLAVLDAIAA